MTILFMQPYIFFFVFCLLSLFSNDVRVCTCIYECGTLGSEKPEA